MQQKNAKKVRLPFAQILFYKKPGHWPGGIFSFSKKLKADADSQFDSTVVGFHICVFIDF
jgi:hypothetical protein